MHVLALITLALTAVAAVPNHSQRIVGGSLTSINNYPELVALLHSHGTTGHRHICGGSIINNRSVLTAAHCTIGDAPARWRTRAGSTNSNSGGVVFNTNRIINHPNYNPNTWDTDIAIIQTANTIVFTNVIRAASLAGANYFLGDNQVVWAAGWGSTTQGGPFVEQLRHVQIWTVNQAVCRNRYSQIRVTITDNMLCSGWLDVGGRDQCQGDSGGPLYHNRVVVGVSSFGHGCGTPNFPGVNVRVSRFINWIGSNA